MPDARQVSAKQPEEARGRNRAALLRLTLGVVLGAGLLVGAAFLLRSDGPRTLPFPTVDPRAPFPELAPAGEDGAEGTPAGDASTGRLSRFEQTLQRAAQPSPAPSAPTSPPEEPTGTATGRTVPLGGILVAVIPEDQNTWRWAVDDDTTLILHAPSGGRPDALILAEPFGPRMADRPSVELHRFHVAADPLGPGGSPLLGTFFEQMSRQAAAEGQAERRAHLLARARAEQILATRTLGRGLGFLPSEDGTTGTRWVGRTEHGIVLRLARSDGTWAGQTPLPAEVATAARQMLAGRDVPTALDPASEPPSLAAVPAYLLAGSAATRNERFGVHLAILCSTSPRCPVAEELAALLRSIDASGPDRARRLRDGFHAPFDELARAAGIDLSGPAEPTAEPAANPNVTPDVTPGAVPSTSAPPQAQPTPSPSGQGTTSTGPVSGSPP